MMTPSSTRHTSSILAFLSLRWYVQPSMSLPLKSFTVLFSSAPGAWNPVRHAAAAIEAMSTRRMENLLWQIQKGESPDVTRPILDAPTGEHNEAAALEPALRAHDHDAFRRAGQLKQSRRAKNKRTPGGAPVFPSSASGALGGLLDRRTDGCLVGCLVGCLDFGCLDLRRLDFRRLDFRSLGLGRLVFGLGLVIAAADEQPQAEDHTQGSKAFHTRTPIERIDSGGHSS